MLEHLHDRLIGSWALASNVQSFNNYVANILPMGASPHGLIQPTRLPAWRSVSVPAQPSG